MKHLLLTVIALLGTVLILLPCLPAQTAGHFIFLSLGAMPLVGSILLIGTVLLFRNKSRWRWVYLWLMIGCLPLVCNHIPGGDKETEEDGSIKVLSWNVTNFHIHSDTLAKTSAYLNTLNPDIICLQEVPHNNLLRWDSIRAAFPEHPYSYKNSRDDEVLNLAVLSKYPLEKICTLYFTDGYNKMASMDVTTPRGTIRLWNVHLQTTGHTPALFVENAVRRNRQAVLLKEKIKETNLPTLVCGDFNDTPSSYAVRTLTACMKDSYQEAGNRFTGSYQPMNQWLRIDYLLCSEQWTVTSYELVENGWSDHKIQVCNLHL